MNNKVSGYQELHSDPDVNASNQHDLNADSERQLPKLAFKRIKVQQIYFKEYLCDEFRLSRYAIPENLRKARNIAIILAFLEFACCLLSFGFYDLRRSRVLLAIIILTTMTTIGGFYAKIKLSYWGILAHALYTVPIIGGFYIYIIFDFFFGTDRQISGGSGLSDTFILLISSLPMVAIFFMGIYSVFLAIKIEEELEQRQKTDELRGIKKSDFNYRVQGRAEQIREARQNNIIKPVEDPGRSTDKESTKLHKEEHVIEVLDLPDDRDENLCAICLNAEPNSVFYPCGHQCLCHPCS